MSAQDLADEGPWSLSLALAVEAVCTRFETAWRAGQRLRIEALLGEAPERARPLLLAELLALELDLRRRSGEVPAPEEYERRFPEHAALIRDALQAAPSAPPADLPRAPD